MPTSNGRNLMPQRPRKIPRGKGGNMGTNIRRFVVFCARSSIGVKALEPGNATESKNKRQLLCRLELVVLAHLTWDTTRGLYPHVVGSTLCSATTTSLRRQALLPPASHHIRAPSPPLPVGSTVPSQQRAWSVLVARLTMYAAVLLQGLQNMQLVDRRDSTVL